MQPNEIVPSLLSSPLVRAALHHRVCGPQIEPLLRQAGLDPGLFQLWGGLGRAVLELFSARRCIGAVGCETAGMATMVVRDLRQAILAAIGGHAQVHMAFGPNQPESERSSQSARDDIAERLVGAVAYERGLHGAICDLVDPVATNIRAVKVSKDAKTVLQELLQAQRHQRPVYEVVGTSGPQNHLVFEVRVTTGLGASAPGSGMTKKAAELAAASKLLRDRYPAADLHHSIRLRPDFDVYSAVDSIPQLPNGAAAINASAEIGLPPWSVGLVSLAAVHRSRSLQTASKFGTDNSILAFLGSHVIAWATADHCLRRLTPPKILERGGIHTVTASLFSYASMVAEVQWLYEAPLPIVRHSEDLAPEGVRKEFLQALLGAIFLARERDLHDGIDAVRGVHGLQAFWETVGDRVADREMLLPSKTVLQEKLQAIDIGIRYGTQETEDGVALAVRPRLELRSPYLRDTLLITGATRTYAGSHKREPKIVIEAELAMRFKAAYTFAMGGKNVNATAESPSDIGQVRAWLFGHFRGLLNDESGVTRAIQSGKILRGSPMGIELLVHQDLDAFGQWFRRSSATLNAWPSYLRDLLGFYGSAGYWIVGDLHRTWVLGELDYVAEVLRASDPLLESGVKRDSSEFRRLTDLATLSKLRSAEVVQFGFDKFAEQIRLLYRDLIELRPGNAAASLAERRGAHLALIGLILDVARADGDAGVPLVASVDERGLTLQVNKTGAISDLIQGRLDSRLLWRALVKIMGIGNVEEDSTRWSATIPSVVAEDALSREILDCWWTFNAGGNLAAATDNALATLLHDVKNEILAYLSAASQARCAARTSERYALAAAASRHTEQALSRLDVVRGLMSSAQTKSFSSINLASLFRSMTKDLLAWLPASVHLEMPQVDPKFSFDTNEDALRSLLGNLVRNAFDALPGSGGSIGIECLVDEDAGQVEFEVRDSGSGFRPEQLEALNRGESIATTKQLGSGLGLLTVLILANSLGGRVNFASTPGSGSRVLLRMPLSAVEAPWQAGEVDASSPKQEVRFT